MSFCCGWRYSFPGIAAGKGVPFLGMTLQFSGGIFKRSYVLVIMVCSLIEGNLLHALEPTSRTRNFPLIKINKIFNFHHLSKNDVFLGFCTFRFMGILNNSQFEL